MSIQLRDALEQHLSGVAPPPGDVVRARREGIRRRRRRRAGAVAGTAAVAAAVVVTLTQVVGPGSGTNDSATDYPAVGRLDFDGGLRAYAEPGGSIWIGGRELDASELDYLDTDATATPYGVVFYDDGRPMLLGEDGEVRALVDGPVEFSADWHPTAKADSAAPHVAWATLRDGVATIAVHDMATDDDVDTLEVECGDCEDLVIDALDGGVVLFRTAAGTKSWQVGSDTVSDFAGPSTRIADLRNGTLLYDGPPPTGTVPQRYLAVRAPVDAQLTHDGAYVLGWSSVLQPTQPGQEPVRLEKGPVEGLGFWNIDTDGSVLVAEVDPAYPHFTVYDCVVPSGDCEALGPLSTESGDPMFIGADM